MRRFVSLLLLTAVLSAQAQAQNAPAPPVEDDEGVTVNLDAIGAPEPAIIPEIPPEGAIVPKAKPLPDAVQVKIVPLPRHKPVLAPTDSAALVAAPPPSPKAEPKAPEIVAAAPPKADLPVTIVENFPMEIRGVAADPFAGTKTLNPAAGYTVIGRIRFAKSASQLPTTAAVALDTVAEKLLLSSERIRLAAYSGATGDMSSQSRRLSLERARTVRNYLVEKGVPFERMDVMPLGGAAAGQSDRVDILAPSS
jgi:outer membrane protein OmpA-like peptidoglycan-associated protein